MKQVKFQQPPVGGVSRHRFEQMFPDERACWDHLKRVRLDCIPCPQCGAITNWTRYTKSRCRHACGMTKGPTEHTMFYRSHLPLLQAYYGLLLFSNMNLGLRTGFIQQHFGLHFVRTVGFIARMRRQAALLEDTLLMGGHDKIVYIDEMLLNVRRLQDGHYNRGRFGLIIFGMRCDQRIQLFVLPERSQEWTRRVIEAYVAPGSTIVTDAFSGYNWLRYSNWHHAVVNHRREWKNSDGFHHGPIDAIFGQLRRFLRGTVFLHCSDNIWEYLREFQFRFNRRWDPDRRFLDLIDHCPTMTTQTLEKARSQCDFRDFFLR